MLREKWHFGWDLWLFVVLCVVCTWRTHFFYDDDDDDGDAHHFLHNLWLIWLEIRSAFSASFQSRFSPNSVSVHLLVKDFYIPKQMINIWFVFSRLNLGCILMWQKMRATKSFARICVHLKHLCPDASAATTSTHENLYPSSRFCLQRIHWQAEFQRRKTM